LSPAKRLLETTGEEIPYVTAVVTEQWEEVREGFTRIHCRDFCSSANHKRDRNWSRCAAFEADRNARAALRLKNSGHRFSLQLS